MGCLKSGEFMSVFVGALILSRGCGKSSDLGVLQKLGTVVILGSSSPNVWILGRGYRRSSDLGAFLKLGSDSQ